MAVGIVALSFLDLDIWRCACEGSIELLKYNFSNIMSLRLTRWGRVYTSYGSGGLPPISFLTAVCNAKTASNI